MEHPGTVRSSAHRGTFGMGPAGGTGAAAVPCARVGAGASYGWRHAGRTRSRRRGTDSAGRRPAAAACRRPAPELTPAFDIVVGVNRDPASQEALIVAADLARRLHAHLHVVHVVDLADYPIDPDASDWEQRAPGHSRPGTGARANRAGRPAG